MFPFQFRLFRDNFIGSVTLDSPWTFNRVKFMLMMFGAFPSFQAVNFLTLLLDELLFPDYRQIDVKEPIFILGNPRSGTTFAHRLLSLDERHMTSLKAYDMALLSVGAKKLLAALSEADGRFGGPVARAFEQAQDAFFRSTDHIHRFRLNQPEEDEAVLIHLFASIFLSMVFPTPSQEAMNRFDELPHDQRRTLMAFYKRCIQRHLYCHGKGERRLLSKNPLFGSKLESIFETFPDARVVYIARSPYEAIASAHSMVSEHWKVHLKLSQEDPAWMPVTDTLVYLYQHALEVLDRHDPSRWIAVRYDDLVKDPRGVVERIYHHFGMPLSPEFEAALDLAARRNRDYSSKHRYELERFGLSKAELYERLRPVFDRFGFPSELEPAAPVGEAGPA